ncbi:MAG: FAD-dependent oxidoreductase [Desulfobacterales bacterium]
MIEALITMGGMGLVIGVVLAASSKVFYVFEDPKMLEVKDALPGANCGGCGLPGCAANAEAIVAGEAGADSCVVGGPDLSHILAEIMGVTVEDKEPDIAASSCTYGVPGADLKYIYDGLSNCRAVTLLGGGMKVCTIGCVGLGSCAKACPFNAITMKETGLPSVDEKRCTGCGVCENVCPKHIITLSSVTRRIMREYTTDECTTPCQRACPAGINIREYIKQISLGNHLKAVQVIKERNPFPAVIGRICPRPCEDECRRKYIDEPVAINFLKRYAADVEKEIDKKILPFKAPATHRKIAIIGGGVDGLSTAFFLARLGHSPMVYEATPSLGGLLRYAISVLRLSDEVLDRDIEGILEMGVKVQTEKILGRDFTISSLLKEGFESVSLALGGWDSRLARLGGTRNDSDIEEPIPGTILLMDFIKHPDRFSLTSNVVIVGGGELALKAAGICKDSGAKNITILFRSSMKTSTLDPEHLEELVQNNIKVIFNTGIVRLSGKGDDLQELQYVDLDTLSKYSIPLHNLLIASGRFPDFIFKRSETETSESSETTDAPLLWEGLEPYKRPAYHKETGLLAKGDTLTDFQGTIHAIGAGRRAAASIHQLMYGISPSVSEIVVARESDVQNVDHVATVAESVRQIMPLSDAKDPSAFQEIEKGFTEEMADAESKRCLQCGLICYQHSGNA